MFLYLWWILGRDTGMGLMFLVLWNISGAFLVTASRFGEVGRFGIFMILTRGRKVISVAVVAALAL